MAQLKLAFAGQMRSGKDTCGDYVNAKYDCKVMKFAAPIYDIMYFAQKRTRRPLEKWRKFLQVVGTDLFRGEDPDVWVNLLIEEVKDLGPSVNVVVTDARFINEFTALQNAGFKVIKIERSETLRNEDMEQGHTKSLEIHASEKDMLTFESFDAILYNNGTLEELYLKVDELVEQLTGLP